MIRNIVFDMGGVLVDYDPLKTCLRMADNSEDAHFIFRTMFLAPEWEYELDSGFFPEEEMLTITVARLNTQAQKDTAVRIYAEYHTDMLPIAGMDDLIRSLHSRGFRIYLLSNTGPRIHQYLHRLPGIDLFDGLLLSCEEKLLKPDAAIYRRLCERFGLNRQECLFVDDKQVNTDGAETVGMQGYCFADGDVVRLSVYVKSLPNP